MLCVRISTQNTACSQRQINTCHTSFSYILWAYGEHIMSKWRERERERESIGMQEHNIIIIIIISCHVYTLYPGMYKHKCVPCICACMQVCVNSVNAAEFWQRQTRPPSLFFTTAQSRQNGSCNSTWSTLHPGSQMIYYNYRFCNNYFWTCFLRWCVVCHRNNLEWNWGSSNIKF